MSGDVLVLDADAAPGGSTPGVVAVTRLPPFAALPDHQRPPEVLALVEAVATASVVVLRALVPPTSGANGSLVNALQLLGGPAYGRSDRGTVLRGKQVRLELLRADARQYRVAAQLTRIVRALGCDDVRPAGRDEPRAVPPGPAVPLVPPGLPGPPAAGSAARGPAGPAVDLALGEVVLADHPWLTEAVRRSAGAASRYAPPAGLDRLRDRIRERRRFVESPGHRDVAITYGASLGLVATLSALVPAGGAVLVPDPAYPPYRTMLRRLGLTAMSYPVPGRDGSVELPGNPPVPPAAIIWNSPHNPTGWVAGPGDLATLAEYAERYQAVVVSDEVYADLIWTGEHHSPVRHGLAERTVVVDSCAKRFAAAGLRVGWVEAPRPWHEQIVRAHWELAMGAPLTTQRAAAWLLRSEPAVLAAVRDQVRDNLSAGAPLLRRCGVESPSAGCYLWLPLPAAEAEADGFIGWLQAEARVRALAGSQFGPAGRGRFRISVGAPGGQVRPALARVDARLRAGGDGSLEPR